MKKTNTIKYIFLLDYYNNHPIGIIYDWIRSKEPKECLIIKHLSYVPYCKSGAFKLKEKSILNNFFKKFRANLIIKFLEYKGYKIINADKEIKNKTYDSKYFKEIPVDLKNEILRDFICNKDQQFSFFDCRLSHIKDEFNKSINQTWNSYLETFHAINSNNNYQSAFIFNGRSLRQKLLSYLFKKNGLKVFYIERNMWNKGRTVISKERIQSFNYLKTNKCKDYGESKNDISIENLYKNVMTQNWKNMQKDLFSFSNKNKKIVTYMSGSSDEYLAFTEEVMIKECQSQISLVRFISDICNENNIDFILRVHPNTRNKSKLDLDLWNDLGDLLISREQIFFSANSNINSYSIIDKSDLIITNGSTITVESCLKGKDVCLCGFSGLRGYKAAKVIKNLNELKNHILQTNINNTFNNKSYGEAKRYLNDELMAGRILQYYSMENHIFKP